MGPARLNLERGLKMWGIGDQFWPVIHPLGTVSAARPILSHVYYQYQPSYTGTDLFPFTSKADTIIVVNIIGGVYIEIGVSHERVRHNRTRHNTFSNTNSDNKGHNAAHSAVEIRARDLTGVHETTGVQDPSLL